MRPWHRRDITCHRRPLHLGHPRRAGRRGLSSHHAGIRRTGPGWLRLSVLVPGAAGGGESDPTAPGTRFAFGTRFGSPAEVRPPMRARAATWAARQPSSLGEVQPWRSRASAVSCSGLAAVPATACRPRRNQSDSTDSKMGSRCSSPSEVGGGTTTPHPAGWAGRRPAPRSRGQPREVSPFSATGAGGAHRAGSRPAVRRARAAGWRAGCPRYRRSRRYPRSRRYLRSRCCQRSRRCREGVTGRREGSVAGETCRCRPGLPGAWAAWARAPVAVGVSRRRSCPYCRCPLGFRSSRCPVRPAGLAAPG